MKLCRVQLFGAFRKYVPQGFIELELLEGGTAGEVKRRIQNHLRTQYLDFKEDVLVAESALATASAVLQDNEQVANVDELALLPPVCGG